ncbi:hypothetical protein CGZ93_17895 [Enemella dayhoffiae]|uniref:Head-to-tail stopper n=1 Tax=Enemella dayhoffiae TaxID=2016507 RepID=A0A255GQG7_9ACTN|nr:hypothetical protein [Enemella dayhoffiae]OYO16633.1 hypothetical protein CGZ93_17895 [Enemella dayhoffiae]
MTEPLPGWCTPHSVTVEMHEGAGAYGDTYSAPVALACWRKETRQLVRDKNGDEVVSEAQLRLRPDEEGRDVEALFVPDSRVTLDSGRITYVIGAGRRDGLGFWDHVEVTLQ